MLMIFDWFPLKVDDNNNSSGRGGVRAAPLLLSSLFNENQSNIIKINANKQ